jgi:tripartite-type tricarboxylate transporter receptor subunit TctC
MSSAFARLRRLRRWWCAGAAALLAGQPAVAPAQDGYPSRPIRWILAISPGGSADALARALQPALGEALGQPLVIDNRPGGGSTIGTELTARSAADGYTLQLITTAHAINASLVATLPYDPVKDFTPISLLVSQSNILAVHPSVPAKTVKELVALARGRPGALSFASGGNGSSPHLSGELFKIVAGVDITHVPYKGSGPALTDLLGGHVQMMFAGPLAFEGPIKSGRLRALAVADKRRLSILSEVPTMTEAGFAGVETGTWYGLVAPARTPRAVVLKIHGAVTRVLQLPQVRARLANDGVDILGDGPDEFGKFLVTEIAKYSKIVRGARLRVD